MWVLIQLKHTSNPLAFGHTGHEVTIANVHGLFTSKEAARRWAKSNAIEGGGWYIKQVTR